MSPQRWPECRPKHIGQKNVKYTLNFEMHLLALYIFCVWSLLIAVKWFSRTNHSTFRFNVAFYIRTIVSTSLRLNCMLLVCYVFVLLHIIIEFEEKGVRKCYLHTAGKWLFTMVITDVHYTRHKLSLGNTVSCTPWLLPQIHRMCTEYTTCDKMALFAWYVFVNMYCQ
jgi:hypothetical protein